MLMIMLLVLVTLVVLIATCRGLPSAYTKLSHSYLVALAAGIELLVLYRQEFVWGPLLGAICIALWALCNRSLPGARLLLLGAAANGLAMLSNHGSMPLDPAVAQALGMTGSAYELLAGSKDTIGQPGALLWLADWLVVRTWSMILVVSPGDLLIGAAVIRWMCATRTAAAAVRSRPARTLKRVHRPAGQVG